eukprot:6489879-Amphidinium_carterae.1
MAASSSSSVLGEAKNAVEVAFLSDKAEKRRAVGASTISVKTQVSNCLRDHFRHASKEMKDVVKVGGYEGKLTNSRTKPLVPC